jgi:hypothetical protein
MYGCKGKREKERKKRAKEERAGISVNFKDMRSVITILGCCHCFVFNCLNNAVKVM